MPRLKTLELRSWKRKIKNEMGIQSDSILNQWLKLSVEDLEKLAKDVKEFSQKYHDWIIKFIKCRYTKEN